MAKPVFVVGWRRSGTTWLSTLISRHPDVAAVRGGREGETGGVVETAFFSHFENRFGDLACSGNRVHAVEVLAASTYFDLSGLDKQQLYAARPLTYAALFQAMQDALAEKQQCGHWLEKTPAHAFLLERILADLPDARFVAIDRDAVAQVRSALGMLQRLETGTVAHPADQHAGGRLKRSVRLILETLGVLAARSHMRRFAARHPDNILLLRYEDLKDDTVATMRQVCDFLGLPFDEDVTVSPYRAGSSFFQEGVADRFLSDADERLIRTTVGVASRMPHTFFRLLARLQHATRRNLPYWFFSSTIERHGWGDIFGEGRTPDLHCPDSGDDSSGPVAS